MGSRVGSLVFSACALASFGEHQVLGLAVAVGRPHAERAVPASSGQVPRVGGFGYLSVSPAIPASWSAGPRAAERAQS